MRESSQFAFAIEVLFSEKSIADIGRVNRYTQPARRGETKGREEDLEGGREDEQDPRRRHRRRSRSRRRRSDLHARRGGFYRS